MNAGLQCIFHCKALVNYLIQEQFENEPLNQRDDLSITRAFISLAKKMYNISSNDNDEYNYYSSSRHYSSYSGSLNPSELRAKFVRKEDKYNNYQQHDSPDLISDFLDEYKKSLENTLNHPKIAAEYTQKHELGLNAQIVEKIIPYSSYVYVPANQAKEQIYNLLNIFQQIDKKSIGPKLPDDNFFYSE